MSQANKIWRTTIRAFVVVLLGVMPALVGNGCATIGPLPAADLSAAGWTVKRGQAVWKFGNDAPEIVGDLLVAARSNGELFAQFSKTPLTVATARYDGKNWELDLAMFQRRIARHGPPGDRFALFQVARQINGTSLPKPWVFSTKADGRWRLENPQTGEYVEGFWAQ